MISVSSNFINAISNTTRTWNIQVLITRDGQYSGSTVDVSDYVKSYTITSDSERRNATLEMEFDNYDYSLSPYNRNSSINLVGGVFDPILDSDHKIVVKEGLLVSGGTYEYVTKFTGYLGDNIDADTFPNSVTIQCRDGSKLLQDISIFLSDMYSQEFPSTNPTYAGKLCLVEYVIQDLINKFASSLNIALQVQQSTNWAIRNYQASQTTLWDAIQLLADSANQDVHFLEDGTLIMKNIIRDFSNITPVYTFDNTVMTKDTINVNDSDVRNWVYILVPGLQPTIATNQDSINKYGTRYFEVHRAMANIISTQDQATQLANMFLQELSYPHPVDQLEVPLDPRFQITDVVSVNNTRLGTNPSMDKFMITRVQDTYSATNKRTSIYLKGYNLYTASSVAKPNAPSSLTYTMQTRTIQNYTNSGWNGNSKTTSFPMLQWTPPTTDASGNSLDQTSWGGYTIYRQTGNYSTGNTWVPISAIPCYINAISTEINYFYDYSVSGGSIYTYKINAINKAGNISSDSNMITITIPNTIIN